MSYSFGNRAMKVGSAALNQYKAPRRAWFNAAWCDLAWSGRICASVSSVARISETIRRYFSACLRRMEDNNASTCTRKSTSSAVGGGISSGWLGLSDTRYCCTADSEGRLNKLCKYFRNPNDALRHPVASEASCRNVVLKRAPAHIIALRIAVLTSVLTLCGAFWLYAGSMIAGAL